MLIVGRKWATGLIRNSSPASVVTAPASMARNLVSWRWVAAAISTSPAAQGPTTRPCSGGRSMNGSNAAPAPSRMIATPATVMIRAREAGERRGWACSTPRRLAESDSRHYGQSALRSPAFTKPRRPQWQIALSPWPASSSRRAPPGAGAAHSRPGRGGQSLRLPRRSRRRARPRHAASVSSRLANSMLPRWRNGSGIGAQANMLAIGTGMSQPARPKHSTMHVAPLLVELRGWPRRCPAGR